MNIQGYGAITAAYSATGSLASGRDRSMSSPGGASTTGLETRVTLSDRAQSLASGDRGVEARLEVIRAKPAADRTNDDVEFLRSNDQRWVEIAAKDQNLRTADEVDYMQKAGGFVNTMANLSPAEKQLYNELVAKGDTDAVTGMNLIALSRMGTGDVTLPNGRTFNPRATEITAENVKQLFSKIFVDSDGSAGKSLDALASYLSERDKAAV